MGGMKFLDPKQWSKNTTVLGVPLPKGVLYFLAGIVAITIALWAAGFAFRSGVYGPTFQLRSPIVGDSRGGVYGGGGGAISESSAQYAVYEGNIDASYGGYGGGMPVPPFPYPIPNGGYSTGADAEEYEVNEYYAEIKVDESDGVCGEITALKSRTDIIFESSRVGEDGCNVRFKTEPEAAASVLSLLESYDPVRLDTNTESIKSRVDDLIDEADILKKQLASIEATLKSSEEAYDEILRLAVEDRDSTALAEIIQAKINLIERMTSQRLAVNSALDRIATAQSGDMDRLEYVFFAVQVFEQKIFDPKQILDDWRMAARQFVQEANTLLMGLSLGILIHAILGLKIALYFFIFLIIAKYGWRFTREFWEK